MEREALKEVFEFLCACFIKEPSDKERVLKPFIEIAVSVKIK